MKSSSTNAPYISDMWEHIFRSLGTPDEQAIVRFIRMVVAGQPELPGPDATAC